MKRYEPIRKYIHLTDKRNTDLSVTNLVGLTIEKRYIPSVANVIGTDLSKYKVIKQGQFACSLMQVSRDGKMPVAMYNGEPSIMSPAYPIFEVNDENELMPEYLHMYLSRPEFDREAVFRAVGGVRGSLDWEDFLDMKMPIPSIEEQRKIVAEYQAVEQRIENNNRLIKTLEDTAQAIYHHTFVENIDPENLPEGWSYSNLKSITEFTIGGDWGKDQPEGNYTHKVLCIRGADMPSLKQCRIGVIPVRYILPKNLQSRKLLPGDVVVEISGGSPTQSTGRSAQMNLIADNYFGCDLICSNFCRVIRPMQPYSAFFYFAFNYMFNRDIFFKYENSSNGLKNLNLEAVLTDEKILIPSPDVSLNFSLTITSIQNSIYYIGQEQDKLNKLLRLLLSKLS